MNKNCEICGSPMGDVHASRRFCYECAETRRRAQESRSKARKDGEDIATPCKYCGTPRTGDRRMRCSACPPIEKKPRSNSKPKAPKKPKKKPRKGCWDLENKSSTQIIVEADALGLSYGQYRSLIDTLFIERYLAVELGIYDGLERIDRAWSSFKKEKKAFKRRLAAKIAQEKADERELSEIEMGDFCETGVHPDNTFHCHY